MRQIVLERGAAAGTQRVVASAGPDVRPDEEVVRRARQHQHLRAIGFGALRAFVAAARGELLQHQIAKKIAVVAEPRQCAPGVIDARGVTRV